MLLTLSTLASTDLRREGGTYSSGLSMLLVVFLERFDGPVSGGSTVRSTLSNGQRYMMTSATTSSETLPCSPGLPLLVISDTIWSEGVQDSLYLCVILCERRFVYTRESIEETT